MNNLMTDKEAKAYSLHLENAILFSKGVVDRATKTGNLTDRQQEIVLGKVMELTAQNRHYFLQEHAEELHDEEVEEKILKGTKIEKASKETPTEVKTPTEITYNLHRTPQETQESKEEETEDEQPEEEETTSNGGQMTLEDKLKAKLGGN